MPGGSEMPLGTEHMTPLETFRFVTSVITVLDSITVYQVSVWETFAWNSACELGGVESGFLIPLEGWERIGSLVPSWSFLSADGRISANWYFLYLITPNFFCLAALKPRRGKQCLTCKSSNINIS